MPDAIHKQSQAFNILWIKTGPLFPLNTGGRKRTHAMLREISRRHRVTYLAFRSAVQPLEEEEAAADYASEKIWLTKHEAPRGSVEFFAELIANATFSTLPYALDKYRDECMEQAIREQVRTGDFDVVVCDFLAPALNLAGLDVPCPTVLFQHNMESEIWRRLAANQHNPLTRVYFKNQYRRMHDAERRLSEKFDGVITVSPDDSRFSREVYRLENVLGDVPTGVDAAFFAEPCARPPAQTQTLPRIGFLGSMDWMPNIEAVQWFVGDILPTIRQRQADLHFDIIGRNPSAELRRLAETDPQIHVSGTVDDIRPHVKACDLIVVPLLSGGGTRIKILEAMAMGVPVLSTTVGAEGLGLIDGEHLVLADSADAFATQVSRLLDDPEERSRLAATGRRQVETAHSWEHATEAFLDHCLRLIHH